MLLKNESREEFSGLLNAYTHRLQPANAAEIDLVEDMVMARWRHRRYWRVEGSLLDSAMQEHLPGESRKTTAPTKALKLAAQIQNSCRRSHERSLQMLLTLRASGCLKPSSTAAALSISSTAPAAQPPLPPLKSQ